jgi:hypothetical protein
VARVKHLTRRQYEQALANGKRLHGGRMPRDQHDWLREWASMKPVRPRNPLLRARTCAEVNAALQRQRQPGSLLDLERKAQQRQRLSQVRAPSAATVPMLPVLAVELRAHRSRVAEQSLARVQPDALVFTTARGKPHGRRNVLRAVYAAGDAVGLNGEGRERVVFTTYGIRSSRSRSPPG